MVDVNIFRTFAIVVSTKKNKQPKLSLRNKRSKDLELKVSLFTSWSLALLQKIDKYPNINYVVNKRDGRTVKKDIKSISGDAFERDMQILFLKN